MDNQEMARFIEKANEAVKDQDLILFSENIGAAKYITTDEVMKREVLISQAMGLYRLHQYDRAAEMMDYLIPFTDGEKRVELLRKKGVCLIKMGQYTEAIRIFHDLVKEYPEHSIWGIGNLGWIHIYLYQENGENDDLQKAEEYCTTAIQMCRDDRELYKKNLINLGNVEWHKCEYEKALHCFQEAAGLDGNNPNVLNNIAAVYVNMAKTNYHLRDRIEENLSRAEMIAEQTKNDFELGQTYLIRARLSIELDQDLPLGKDFYMVAFDRFLSAHSFPEALKTLSRISSLDYQMNKESIEILGERLKSLCEKHFIKREEVFL